MPMWHSAIAAALVSDGYFGTLGWTVFLASITSYSQRDTLPELSLLYNGGLYFQTPSRTLDGDILLNAESNGEKQWS